MKRENGVDFKTATVMSKMFLVMILLQHSLGFDLFEEEKRQGGLIPAARLGRDAILEALEEMKQPQTSSGLVFAYPRIGRQFGQKHKTLIPYPRAGRFTFDPESMDYDILLNSGGVNDILTDSFFTKPSKRSIRLVPRIGRKKRSVSGKEGAKGEADRKEEDAGQFFDDLEDVVPYYYRSSDGQAPGKRRSKMAFIPRVGKKRSDDDAAGKRAMAFTPRVGRTAFVPRIGRNDMQFRLMSRAALIPRVGKRA